MLKNSFLSHKLLLKIVFFVLFLITNASLTVADVDQGANFFICGQACSQSKYYVGYNRTNTASLGKNKSSLLVKPDTIFLNTCNASAKTLLPNVDEQRIDNKNGNFVSSIHRIENVQIGFTNKSELMNVHTYKKDSYAEAKVKLFWGDTFTVTSRTLQKGALVKVNIERIIGGFGKPVTNYANYQAFSKTFINGNLLTPLKFHLQKEVGANKQDKISGEAKLIHTSTMKIGDTFTIESLQEVVDGVKVNAEGYQTLNGADSVMYKITLAGESSKIACLESASGTFRSGSCK